MISIYTDGAYAISKNIGGWAFVATLNDVKIFQDFNYVIDTTNNRMEIQSVIEALKWAKDNNIKDFEIISDSMYVIGTMTKNWKKGKNVDLWETLDDIIKDLNVKWTHVKGHNGNKYNELCDTLAVIASNPYISKK